MKTENRIQNTEYRKKDYEHVSFEQSGDEWLCSVKNTEQTLCKIGRYGPLKRYYANITQCLLDDRRLLEIADFVGQLNGENNPTSETDTMAASDEAKQVTEALALQDARV